MLTINCSRVNLSYVLSLLLDEQEFDFAPEVVLELLVSVWTALKNVIWEFFQLSNDNYKWFFCLDEWHTKGVPFITKRSVQVPNPSYATQHCA